ncbi:MAG: ferrochelatase [Thermodesulfobacteriota bacterium]
METRTNTNPIGVVLLNMGGPEKLADVEPFLFNLFADRNIIRLSPFPFLQKFIARKIARKRAVKSRKAYELIGGSSPLARITAEQGQALARELTRHGRFVVGAAMRYWRPRADDTLEKLAAAGIRQLVALPLYPHYSRATTGSSFKDLERAVEATKVPFELALINAWPDQPDYVAALAETIRAGLARFPHPERVTVVYSAHSLPVSFIVEGDPYLDHVSRTIAAVERETGIGGKLCFQSRSGPVRWLTPSTPDMIRELAGQGMREILMVPISFVSDHVETLYEIDIQYRELAAIHGVRLERTVALNAHPRFIAGLAALVLDACRQQGFLPA